MTKLTKLTKLTNLQKYAITACCFYGLVIILVFIGVFTIFISDFIETNIERELIIIFFIVFVVIAVTIISNGIINEIERVGEIKKTKPKTPGEIKAEIERRKNYSSKEGESTKYMENYDWIQALSWSLGLLD